MAPPSAPPPRGPPKALPLILFFALPLVFALGVTPLLASNRNPNDNVGRLTIRVASFDSGNVGAALVAFAAAAAGSPGMPGLTVVDAAGTSPDGLRQAVHDSEAWGAVWVEAGASARLASALSNPSAPYDPAAIHFLWDEGRNSLVTTGRVGAPIKGALAGFTARFAATLVAGLPNATLTDAARLRPSLLTSPVTVVEESPYAASSRPVTGVGLTIGNILVAVFALAITNAILMALTPLFSSWGLRGGRMIAARTVAVLAYTAAVSATMATMLLTLAGMTEHGDAWARTWATFWVMQASFVFYLMACGLWRGPALIPLFFLLLLLSNIIGGWNTTTADPGYMAFSCTSMYHALALLRYVRDGVGWGGEGGGAGSARARPRVHANGPLHTPQDTHVGGALRGLPPPAHESTLSP